MIETVGVIAAVVLPLWNIPLIMRMITRKSSDDISIYWALGVFTCMLVMAPSGFTSEDMVWKVFNIVNLLLFSFVVATVLYYRFRR